MPELKICLSDYDKWRYSKTGELIALRQRLWKVMSVIVDSLSISLLSYTIDIAKNSCGLRGSVFIDP